MAKKRKAPQRQCGECTVCCTVMIVDELNKPERTPCPHLAAAGCGIYNTRPSSCRTWICGWLRPLPGLEAAALRPDRCGILVWAFDRTVFVHVEDEEALKNEAYRQFVRRCERARLRVLVRVGEKTL